MKLGQPVVAGTRITVGEILERLAGGAAVGELLDEFPGLTPDGVRGALRFAANAVRDDSPLEKIAPLDLHGGHRISIPGAAEGEALPAIAIRTFQPEAAGVAVRRLLPASGGETAGHAGESAPTLHPMERVHPAGVFEAVFPGETEVFRYQLSVTRSDGGAVIIDTPFGVPPFLTVEDLPESSGAKPADSDATGFEGRAFRWHERLGAHLVEHAGLNGVAFAVWAPKATGVSVVGDFNRWNGLCHPMRPVGTSGIWELFVPGLREGDLYKYRIAALSDGRMFDKADPYAFAAELRPGTASVVWDIGRDAWHDAGWLESRRRRQAPDAPIAIYEVHLGSWQRPPAGEGGGPRWLTYRELADRLIPYVREMGYTHIEPMPVAEHPFDGSWGYQITGFFAPTSRYGTPDDFCYFVDRAHQAGLGVILDWVPGHFPKDAHGLAFFDGTHLYEHDDPRRSENLEWGTSSFNLERPEVCEFLLSNALFWLEQYHIDGLRVDAVSSMIYLDYSRQHWVPNALGGRENLEAAAFLQRLNALVHREHPGVLMIAEESTAWPHVTGRDSPESLGFDLKWNLGWMHDTLGYAERDPVHRSHHHNNLTFSLVYAFSERFLLPLSHDEVVHGKRSLLSKMPGDPWQQFANLRMVFGYQYAHPGKKLHFMGGEFGSLLEWNHDTALDWSLPDRQAHAQLRAFVKELNRVYVSQGALHETDFSWEGFQWIDCEDAARSIVSFLRRGKDSTQFIAVAANFTPVPRENHRLGVPLPGRYVELLNSDSAVFGGSGVCNSGALCTEPVSANGQPYSLTIALPPLGIVFFGPAAAE